MKLAAVRALAGLAKTPVPDIVNMAYNEKTISFRIAIYHSETFLIHGCFLPLHRQLQKQPLKAMWRR